jgi:hypothetical protein
MIITDDIYNTDFREKEMTYESRLEKFRETISKLRMRYSNVSGYFTVDCYIPGEMGILIECFDHHQTKVYSEFWPWSMESGIRTLNRFQLNK